MASKIKNAKSGDIFVAIYRPHQGKDAELKALIKEHVPTLRKLELITERPAILMKAKDGSYIEICEWAGPYEELRPPEHPEVARIWEAMGKIADFPGLSELQELKEQFPHFKPVEL